MRASIEDTFCWTTNENPYVFSVIRIPIILSVLVSLFLKRMGCDRVSK